MNKMKKIIKSLFAFVLCLCTLFTFTACDNNLSATTNSSEGVVSNGGVSVYYDGWLYFVNGTKTASKSNVTGNIVNGALYRVKADAEGNILYNTTTDDDGNEIKSFDQIELVINKLVGFKYGSIRIYGDFLYYTTPCTEKNKSGEMLYGKTEFRRYDLVNKKDQLLYTSNASDDDLTFGFVKQSTSLYLVIFEKNSATLTSLLMGDKVTSVFVKEEVKSALISDENTDSVADGYVYYTLSYGDDDVVKRGVKVYKVLPDGKGEILMNSGKDVTLLTVKGDKLIYSYDSAIYAKAITSGEDTLSFDADAAVCYNNYENIIFLAQDGKLTVLVYEDEVLRSITWNNGVMTNQNFHEFDSDEKITFIGVDGDWVIYQSSSIIYKSKFQNWADEEEKIPVQLSTSKIKDADELMAPEIINGYLYCFCEDSSTNLTYMYRIKLETPDEAKAAEFIGLAE